jgi:hypothetical protein
LAKLVEPAKVSGKRHNTALFLPSSVTRLGEFSPIGRVVYFRLVLKITTVAQFIGLLFFTVQVKYKFRHKLVLATYWAILLQTHLVTLPPSFTGANRIS